MTRDERPSGGVDRTHGRSFAERLTFAALHLASVAVCGWLVLGGGVATVSGWFGWSWSVATPLRAQLVLGATALYFARHCVTLFYLLRRRVAWSEALGLSAFIFVFEVGFCLLACGVAGGTALGALDVAAVALVVVGSYLNTASEVQRNLWKAREENKGRCYTQGLFRLSMHVNYFGDVVLFTGWALLTGVIWALVIPVLMTIGFVASHIPGLDAYLAERYGDEFTAYAARTKKLVPFVY